MENKQSRRACPKEIQGSVRKKIGRTHTFVEVGEFLQARGLRDKPLKHWDPDTRQPQKGHVD